MKRSTSPANRDGARFVCPSCENDVWQSEDGSLFRLFTLDGVVAVAEQLSKRPPIDLDRVVCSGCDFAFRWRDRAPSLFDEVPVTALGPFELQDAIHEIRAARERLELTQELLGPSTGRVPRQLRRADRILARAERSVARRFEI